MGGSEQKINTKAWGGGGKGRRVNPTFNSSSLARGGLKM